MSFKEMCSYPDHQNVWILPKDVSKDLEENPRLSRLALNAITYVMYNGKKAQEWWDRYIKEKLHKRKWCEHGSRDRLLQSRNPREPTVMRACKAKKHVLSRSPPVLHQWLDFTLLVSGTIKEQFCWFFIIWWFSLFYYSKNTRWDLPSIFEV